MVAQLSMLRVGYWLCLLISAVAVLTRIGPFTVPIALVAMLIIHVAFIPGMIAWGKAYGALLKDALVTICFIIAMYGFLFFEKGMESAQPLSVPDAMRYSLGVWANSRPEGLVVADVWALSTIESITSYFVLALLVALIVLWVQEAAEDGKRYVNWLGRQSAQDIEKATGLKIPASRSEHNNP